MAGVTVLALVVFVGAGVLVLLADAIFDVVLLTTLFLSDSKPDKLSKVELGTSKPKISIISIALSEIIKEINNMCLIFILNQTPRCVFFGFELPFA